MESGIVEMALCETTFFKVESSESPMGVHFYRFHCLCLLLNALLIKTLNIYLALENPTSKQNVHWSELNEYTPWEVGEGRGIPLNGPNEARIAIAQ